jgi:hypothetical protein
MPIPYVFTKTFDLAYPSYKMDESGEHEGRASGTYEVRMKPEISKKKNSAWFWQEYYIPPIPLISPGLVASIKHSK